MRLNTDNYLVDLRSPHWQQSEDGRVFYWDSLGVGIEAPFEAITRREFSKVERNWASIAVNEDSLTLAADLPRSHALFYSRVTDEAGTRWVVSDNPAAMREHLPHWSLDKVGAEVFALTGFTLNERTLIDGVAAVEAASSAELSFSGGGVKTSCWRGSLYSNAHALSGDEFTELYAAGLDRSVGDLLKLTAGRQLVLPLSGGLDSRLLAAWLRICGASDLLAFTYGKPGSAEAQVACQTAELLGIPIEFIPLDSKEMRAAWFSEDADEFRADTWKGTALPHVQDWWALNVLKVRGIVAEDAVILPGHTVVGAMHDEGILDGVPSGTVVARALAHHHSADERRWMQLSDNQEFRRAVKRVFHHVPDGPRRVQEAIEWFNVRERQAKYINNSMSAYEYFGWDWALPLYWRDAREAWFSGPQRLSADRTWYRSFVDAAFARATGERKLAYFASPAESSSIPLRDQIVRLARKTGVNKVISRLWELRVELDHPLALEAFTASESTPRLLAELARHGSLRSTWIRSFLANRWGSQTQRLVPNRLAPDRHSSDQALSDRPRLLLISYSDISRDARLRRQVDLFSADYEVTVLGHGEAFETPAELVLFDNAETRWSDRLRAALLHMRQYRLAHRFEANNVEARKLLRGREFDAVIANDIEPVGLALELFGPDKVHPDLHEYYPGLLDEDPAWVKLRRPYYRWMLRNHAAKTRSVTTVSTAIAQRYREEFGFKCGVVENARPDAHLAPTVVHEPIRLVHAGAALPNRNIEQMMRAAAASRADVTIDLFLTGAGTKYYADLRSLAERLGPRVTICEPVDPNELVATLNQFDVGVHILPPRPTNNYLALPNKFFDFVQARLGLIVGPTPAMESRVRTFDIGEVTADFSEESLVEAIDGLNADRIEVWKRNANRAAADLDVSKALSNWAAPVRQMAGQK